MKDSIRSDYLMHHPTRVRWGSILTCGRIMVRVLPFTFFFIGLMSVAFGQTIVNSKHDLSNVNTGMTQWQSTNEVELCVFCHTPHTSLSGIRPLWNKTLPSNSTYAVYSSSTLDVSPSTNLSGSYSLLCLSCHDGVTAMNALVNPSHIGQPVMAGNYTKLGQVYFPGSIFTEFPGANIGEGYDGITANNLSNDHPVDFMYDAAHPDVVKGTLYNPDAQPSGLGGTITQKMLFNRKMECPSCHNAHNPTYQPFLRKSIVGSGLCLSCHNK